MKLNQGTLQALKHVVIAVEEGEQPYFNGSELVDLFEEIGIYEDTVRMGRRPYVLEQLQTRNGSQQLNDFIEKFLQYALLKLDPNKEIEFIEKINRILKVDNYEIKKTNDRYCIFGNDINNENIKVKVHFEDIQKQIIEAIQKAEYTIWVAVAWFTDKKIFEELVRKSKEGVSIRIMIIDDPINNSAGLPLEAYFETCKRPPWEKSEYHA